MSIKELYLKYKDVIPYLFFGICTTLVNTVAYWLFAYYFSAGTMASTIIAWFLAVLFAYITNRKWVFHSEAQGIKAIIREIISFFGSRVATGLVDWICMFVFVDVLHFNDMIIKIAANIIVIVLNYIFSKFITFKKKTDKK